VGIVDSRGFSSEEQQGGIGFLTAKEYKLLTIICIFVNFD